MYSCLVKVVLHPLQPLVKDTLWHIVTGVLVPLQFFFLKEEINNNLVVQGQNCRVDVATL